VLCFLLLGKLSVAYQVYKKQLDDTAADNSAFQRPFQRWRGEVLAKTGPKAAKKRKTSSGGSQAGSYSRPAPVLPDGDPTEAEVRACLPPHGYKVYQDCSNNRCHTHSLFLFAYCVVSRSCPGTRDLHVLQTQIRNPYRWQVASKLRSWSRSWGLRSTRQAAVDLLEAVWKDYTIATGVHCDVVGLTEALGCQASSSTG
jgi:hypothetical protein